MSEQKHTPGPWTLKRVPCSIGCCDDLHNVLAQYPEDKEPARQLASVDGGNAVWLRAGEALANAHLIAAAPDLLAACKAVARDIDEHCDGRITADAMEMLYAAIALAEQPPAQP